MEIAQWLIKVFSSFVKPLRVRYLGFERLMLRNPIFSFARWVPVGFLGVCRFGVGVGRLPHYEREGIGAKVCFRVENKVSTALRKGSHSFGVRGPGQMLLHPPRS